MGAGGRRFKSSLLDQFRRVAQLGQRTCLGRTGSVVRIHSRRPVCLRRTFCGVAKRVRRLPVKQEMRRACPERSEWVRVLPPQPVGCGEEGSPRWSHKPSRAGSTPASATRKHGVRVSGFGFAVSGGSVFPIVREPRTPNPESRGKTMRVWYMGCALVRQTRETCSSHVTRSRILGW